MVRRPDHKTTCQTDKTTGKRKFRAGPDCKASQAYPQGFGEAVAQLYLMHQEDVREHRRKLENDGAHYDISKLVFKECNDMWSDAELGVVFDLLS